MAFTQYIVETIHTSNSMVGGMDYDHRSVGLGHQNSAHHSEWVDSSKRRNDVENLMLLSNVRSKILRY